MKRKFRIVVWYFKSTGKFYSEGTCEIECTDCGQPEHPSCYMDDAVQHIKQIPLDDEMDLPGLSCSRWDGPVLLNCKDGYPVLLLEGVK